MKLVKTEDAVGQVLCQDMTQIIPGTFKGPRFKKGHVVTKEDIPVLLSMGKENLYIYELKEGWLHENDAAARLAALCGTENMILSEPSEGKIELRAAVDGCFLVDSEKLLAVNSIEQLMMATKKGGTAVKKGDKLCGTRVIPLVIEEEKIREAEAAAEGGPILAVKPYALKTAAIITTGSEVKKGMVQDAFTPVVKKKIGDCGITTIYEELSGDGTENVSGARVVTYGAPVLPGAMLMLAYFEDGTPILGLPGCIMFARATVFDLLLPRIAAGVRISKQDIVSMGEGGLCLGCKPCTYPQCPFGA